jgi:hypothetical protein
MNVFILDADVNKYRGIYYQNEDDIVEFNRRFDGTPLGKRWTGKEKFALIREGLPKGDTPGLSSHIPVFSTRAVKVLADFLGRSGEILPIRCDPETYFLFNVTHVIDALDEANSEIERFDDGGILDIVQYAFVEQKLKGEVLFKMPQDLLGWVYVTDPFVDRVRAAGLKGFKFRLVWSSD